ncbi:AraC family transcriptional regulator [Pseudomonas oryzihabitans]|nr:AraC family transcriptional regulator [Pseudomonas psychrotolerans]KTT67513.1 AraC family transcriptional regulator [Pseudomonas psychrotolerans]
MNSAHYSTLVVSAERRFEYWKEVVCRHCIPASSRQESGLDFDAQLQVTPLGLLDVCTLSAPLHHWRRTANHLRTGPDDDLWLGFSQGGHGQLEQGGRQAVLAPNRLFLYDADQAFDFSLGGDNRLVRIPRYLLSTRLPGVERLTATVLDEARPGIVPLREMLRQAADGSPALEDETYALRFSQTLLDLLVLSLELQGSERAVAERDLYPRLMNHVLRHLSDPQLNLESVAQAHHVSTRTVTRAFARHQKTLMSVILQERLLASRQAMEQGRCRSVSQAALDFGFSDFSHFSRAFRKAFGVAPHSLLQRH